MRSLFTLYPFYFFFLLLAALKYARRTRAASAIIYKKWGRGEFACLGLLLAAGAYLRIRYTFHIDLDPYGWGYITDALSIKDLLTFRGQPHHILTGAIHVPGYACLIALPLFFTKSLYAISGLNLALSILTIALIYAITKVLSRDAWASFLAAAAFTFSIPHIVNSGSELPMTASAFFVLFSFLFLFLWSGDRRKAHQMASILFLFIAINIKVENIVFLPVLCWSFLKEGRGDPLTQRHFLKYVLLMLAAFLAFSAPFLINHHKALLWVLKARGDYPRHSLYSAANLVDNLLILLRFTKGFPLYVLTAYAALKGLKKAPANASILLSWFGVTLLFLSWYDISSLKWNLLQILIPLYILLGLTVSEALRGLIKNGKIRLSVILIFFCAAFWVTKTSLATLKMFSWVDLKKSFFVSSRNDCIVTLDIFAARSALRILFPESTWIFYPDTDTSVNLGRCKGRLYYLNLRKFGLEEETDNNEILRWEGRLKEKYDFTRAADIDLFLLTEK